MSTQRPEQTPQRPSSQGPLQPHSAASYAELAAAHQPADATTPSQTPTRRNTHGWKPVKSPWPGYVGFVAVLIALLIMFSVMGSLIEAAIPYLLAHQGQSVNYDYVLDLFTGVAPDAVMLVRLAGWLGIAGVILGAVGAIIGRGRGVGLIAVVAGFLSPVIIGFYIGMTAAASLPK